MTIKHPVLLILSSTLLFFALFGCTEQTQVPGLPYTVGQYITKTTDLNYTLYQNGFYDGNCLKMNGSKITAGPCVSVDANIPWNQIINFPTGCGEGQAVKIVGSSLVCVDLNATIFLYDDWNKTGNDIWNNNSGNVGLRNLSPTYLLDINGQTRGYTNSAVTTGYNFIAENAGTGDAIISFLLTGAERYTMGIDNSDGDKFKITDGTALNLTESRLTIDNTGNIGINLNTPSSKLDVNGSTNLRENLQVAKNTTSTTLGFLDATLLDNYNKNELIYADIKGKINVTVVGTGSVTSPQNMFDGLEGNRLTLIGSDNDTNMIIDINMTTALSAYSNAYWQPFVNFRNFTQYSHYGDINFMMSSDGVTYYSSNDSGWYTNDSKANYAVNGLWIGGRSLNTGSVTTPKYFRFVLTRKVNTGSGSNPDRVYISEIGLRHWSAPFSKIYVNAKNGDNWGETEWFKDGTESNPSIKIDGNLGRIGINRVSPSEALDVNGNINQYDSQKHYFGSAKDASINYDGTDLIIDPDSVGTGMIRMNGVVAPEQSGGYIRYIQSGLGGAVGAYDLGTWIAGTNQYKFGSWDVGSGFIVDTLGGRMSIGVVPRLNNTNNLHVSGDANITTNIYQDGNFFGNQIYGEDYNKFDGGFETVNLITPDVYERVTKLGAGNLNGFTVADGNLIAGYAGIYQVNTKASVSVGVMGETGMKVFVNDNGKDNCYSHQHLTSVPYDMVITCLVRLNAGDKVNVRFDDHQNPVSDVVIDAMNINLVRVGN